MRTETNIRNQTTCPYCSIFSREAAPLGSHSLAYMCLADANAMPVDGGGDGRRGKSCLPLCGERQNAAENRSSTPFPPLLSVHVFDLPKDTIHGHRKKIRL